MTDPGPRRISGSNELTRAIVSILDAYGNPVGSGFIVAGSGLILTAAHVITACMATAGDVLEIGFVGRGPTFRLTAQVDPHHFFPQPELDGAVLRPRGPLHEFCAGLEFGDSGDLVGRKLASYGFPADRTSGLGAAISGVSYQPEPPGIHFSSTDVARGFSGGPLVDTSTLRAIGIVRAILAEEEGEDYKRLRDGFAVPIEAVGAAIVEVYARRPHDPEIARLLECISANICPRVQWPMRQRLHAAPQDAATLAQLNGELTACLAAARSAVVAGLLLRLPQNIAAEAVARVGVEPGPEQWAQALVTACTVDLDGLPLLVASLHGLEVGPPLRELDRTVKVACDRLHGEFELRDWIADVTRLQVSLDELRRRVNAIVLAEQRPEFDRVEARHVPAWAVRALADRRPEGTIQPLERLVRGDVEPALTPAPIPAADAQGVLIVVIHSAAQQGFNATIWATRDAQPPVNVQAEDVGLQSRDALLDNIYRARDERGRAWGIASSAWTIEFALPCELLQLDCEEWLVPVSAKRSAALGGYHTVYLRSREWIYEKGYEAFQPDWQANWSRYHAEPRLTWLDQHETRDPEALLAMLKGTPGVGLKFLHGHTQAFGDDPVHICVEAMVPVVLWRRGPEGEAPGSNECDDLRALPTWVREQRKPKPDRPANRGLVLIWNDPGRIPPDALSRKFNVPRKAAP